MKPTTNKEVKKIKKDPADNPIKKVMRNKQKQAEEIVFVYEGEDYTFIFNNKGKIICTSGKLLDEVVFKEYQNKLRAIFMKNRETQKQIHGNNKEENSRLDLLKEFRCYVLENGKLLILRSEKGKNISMIYKDLDAAIRAQREMVNRYIGENESVEGSEMFRMFSGISIIHEVKNILFDWNSASDEDIKRAQDFMKKTIENLSRCRNDYKVNCLEQIKSSVTIKDSTGKLNPGAVQARTVSAIDNLEKRKKRIPELAKFVAFRKEVLMLEKKQMQLNIIDAAFSLKFILNSNLEFFRNKEVFYTKINQVLYLLQSVWLNPYIDIIVEVKKNLQEAKLKVDKGEIELAKKFLSGAQNTLLAIQ